MNCGDNAGKIANLALAIDYVGRSFAHALKAHQLIVKTVVRARRLLVVIRQEWKLVALLARPRGEVVVAGRHQ